jgi:hypothetical protein
MLAINYDYKNDIPAINAIEAQIRNMANQDFLMCIGAMTGKKNICIVILK